MSTISLDEFINIGTVFQNITNSRKDLSLSLLVGVVPETVSAFSRYKVYSSLEELASDGFLETDRLYKAASLFFSQSEHPDRIAIGKIGSVSTMNSPAEGEILLMDAKKLSENAEVGKYITSSGEVSGVLSAGASLIIADASTRAETPLETIKACREFSEEWYMVFICSEATSEQVKEVAAFVESVRPSSLLGYTTQDSNVLNSESESIFKNLKAMKYNRSIGLYSSQSNAEDAIVAYGAKLLAKLKGSSPEDFSSAYVGLAGISPENAINESFSASQMKSIQANNGNVYVNTGNYYDVLVNGRCASGIFADEVMLGDKFEYDCQTALADLLFSGAVIPQNNTGGSMLEACLNAVCSRYAAGGYIQPGKWTAEKPTSLKGVTLPEGYKVEVGSFDEQSEQDRQERKAPPVFVYVKLGGKCLTFTITNYINR